MLWAGRWEWLQPRMWLEGNSPWLQCPHEREKKEGWDYAALRCSLLLGGLGSRTLPGRKGVKGLLLMGHEKVSHGFGLTGERSSNSADGAGTEGLWEPQTSTSFPEYGTLDWAEGRKEGLCASVGVLKDFSIFNEDIKSLLQVYITF